MVAKIINLDATRKRRLHRRLQGSTMAKTILIVDDNAYIRRGLCGLFKREEDFEICGEADKSGGEARASLESFRLA